MFPSVTHLRHWFRILGLLGSGVMSGAAPAPDKSGYSLSNPTPTALLRELTTDRPDTTESPFTVDAGHLQLEMDFGNIGHNRHEGTATTAAEAAPFNLRVGLRNNFEAGVFVSPFVYLTETPPGGPRTARSGFGDLTLRGKFNFWGNDGGETAGGLIVDVALPTAAPGLGRDNVEVALILPFAFALGGGWDGGAMTVLEFRHAAAGTGYYPVWTNSATFGHDLGRDLSCYAELTSTAGDGPHVATLDLGLTWKIGANLQFDCGVNLGLSHASDDLLAFAGVARRF